MARNQSPGPHGNCEWRSLSLKQAEVRASVNPERIQKYMVNMAIWLFVRDPKKLDAIEREDLATFCQASASLIVSMHYASNQTMSQVIR